MKTQYLFSKLWKKMFIVFILFYKPFTKKKYMVYIKYYNGIMCDQKFSENILVYMVTVHKLVFM